MKRKLTLHKSYQLTGIIVFILTILGSLLTFYDYISQYINSFEKKVDPFTVTLTPEFIEEGQHSNGHEVTLSVSDLNKNNITSLRIYKRDIIIDRLNKSDQTKIAGFTFWKVNNGDLVLSYYPMYPGYPQDMVSNSGILGGLGCVDCFMGKDRPYRLKLHFTYVRDGLEGFFDKEFVIRIV